MVLRLHVQQQVNPKNNDDVELAFEKAFRQHPKVDCIVYDRNCSLAPSGSDLPKFAGVKFWPVDKWHGARHTDGCRYSPQNVPKYAKRLKHVNTSVCAQTFSWFRNYARSMNEMKPLKQGFLILLYVKEHNKLMASGTTHHISSVLPRKQKKGHYACAKKDKASKHNSAMKKPSANEKKSSMKGKSAKQKAAMKKCCMKGKSAKQKAAMKKMFSKKKKKNNYNRKFRLQEANK